MSFTFIYLLMLIIAFLDHYTNIPFMKLSNSTGTVVLLLSARHKLLKAGCIFVSFCIKFQSCWTTFDFEPFLMWQTFLTTISSQLYIREVTNMHNTFLGHNGKVITFTGIASSIATFYIIYEMFLKKNQKWLVFYSVLCISYKYVNFLYL